jgi:muconolactone D-isomerase
MEFLVRQSAEAASALPPQRREELRAAERARAAELREAGVLVRIWRVLGSSDSIALYQAPDADALHEALVSLPMFPWLKFTVEPLVTHPQEKRAAPEPAAPAPSAPELSAPGLSAPGLSAPGPSAPELSAPGLPVSGPSGT